MSLPGCRLRTRTALGESGTVPVVGHQGELYMDAAMPPSMSLVAALVRDGRRGRSRARIGE